MKKCLLLVGAIGAWIAGAEVAQVRPGGVTELAEAQVRFAATAFYPGWISREARGGFRPETDGSRRWTIPPKDYDDTAHPAFGGRTSWQTAADGALAVSYAFEGQREVELLQLAVVGRLPNEIYAGGTMWADGKTVGIPAAFKSVSVFGAAVTNLVIADAKGVRRLSLEFPTPTQVNLQDNRSWQGKAFSVRMLLEKGKFRSTPGSAKTLAFTIRAEGSIACETAAYRIVAGPEWIPLEEGFDVEPGSALDFTDIAGTGKPAGKYGRPVVRNGHFEFENLPGKAQRFYGVNFVGGSNYPEEKYAKPFAATLARLGYNAVRMHHHDNGIAGAKDGTLDEKMMARFDAFIAALIENGLYVTTDLYVSRRPPYRDCGFDKDGKFTDINAYKRVAMFHEGTFQNYLRHARALLAHVNPHTGRRYADEPALGWISLVNEGTLGSSDFSWLSLCEEEVLAKWRTWLKAKKAADPAYAAVPETRPFKMRDLTKGDIDHKNAFLLFLTDVEREFARRVTKVVREELGCRALLTNMNFGYKSPSLQKLIADEFDYMDDHFYVDHPHFLEKRWQLPSDLPNVNSFQRRTCGAMYPTCRRIFGMPFVITEYNYSCPGRYRGVGGIATGAMAAIQDWDGLWRFAWSHGDAGVKGPRAMDYFDMSGDPLGLASERASMCLFLRRDVEPYANTLAYQVEASSADALATRQGEIPAEWRPSGWWAKVGCWVGDAVPDDVTVVGRAGRNDQVETPPARPANLVRPIEADATSGSFRIDTPRTAGGFAEKGTIRAGAVAVTVDSPATVWASSLDGAPLAVSKRILLTHLTDVQDTGITYADSSKRILLDWGRRPHLMRVGTAEVALALADGDWKVYSLSPSGRRRGEISSAWRDGRLCFTAAVARDTSCATYLYELVRQSARAGVSVGGVDVSFALRLNAREKKGEALTVTAADMACCERHETAAGTEVVWSGHPRCGETFTVKATFRPGADGWTYGLSFDGNESGLDVEEIRFPVVEVSRTAKTALLYPRQSGLLRRPDWSKFKDGELVQATGPNVCGFRFAAALDETGGWYLDQRGDARLRPVQYRFVKRGEDRVEMSAAYFPTVSPETRRAGRLPFEGTFRRFAGGWFAAAKIYRDWVTQEDWCKKARARNFGKLRDVALWMWNRGRSDQVIPSVERFMDETGLPAALDWYWWHQIPYDVEYPRFWPPREGEAKFAEAVKRLEKRGVYVQTYTNGMLRDMEDDDWPEKSKEAIRFRNGGLDQTTFNVYLNHRMAIMCGEAPGFQRELRAVERKIAATGLDALYLDMIGNFMGSCWNPAHRHAPGGGTVVSDGYRALLRAVRADNPGVHLSTEEEGESYIDLVDSFITLYAGYERLGRGVAPEYEMLPVFQMIYHGCVALYGSYSVIDGITPWDEKWGERPPIDEAKWAGRFPDQFAVEFARGVTWGIQPTVHKLLVEHQTEAKWADEWKFVKDTARFYHANRDLLFDGEMCAPGQMTCRAKPVDFFIRGCYTKEEKFRTCREEALPTVFHSIWRPCGGGSPTAVVVNWTREPQAFSLKAPDIVAEGTLPPRSWRTMSGSCAKLSD